MARRRVGSGVQYVNLNDACAITPMLLPGRTEIWYVRPEHARDLSMGLEWVARRAPHSLPDTRNLARTHVMVGRVKGEDKEKIFDWMQDINWSPRGEARTMIDELGLWHTSMSVGDILVVRGRVWSVALLTLHGCPSGFVDLGRVDE